MPNMWVRALLATTIIMLLISLWRIRRIRGVIHSGSLRAAWTGLSATLILAVFGCLLFVYTNDMEGDNHHEDWLIALTLFAAAGFVLGVCEVSLRTGQDLARIDDLEKAAFFDPVTDVYTRGHIDSLLEVEWARSRAETQPLSVLMLDIDDFKFINDCFGHRAGDYVLKELARVIKQTASIHLVGRYGGEEFLIVAPRTALFLAEKAAERIRTEIAAASLVFEGHAIAATVSIGVKTTFTFREAAKELVADADIAMYEAKRRGRNQVALCDEKEPFDSVIPTKDLSPLIDSTI